MDDIDKFQPDYIIGMGRAGLSQDKPKMEAEQNAYAIPGYKLHVDVAGHKPAKEQGLKILPAEAISTALKEYVNEHCVVKTDADAGNFLCERSLFMSGVKMAEYGKGATFVHLSEPTNKEDRADYIAQYASAIHQLAQKITAEGWSVDTVPFRKSLPLMHCGYAGLVATKAQCPITDEIRQELFEEAARLREKYPIMRERTPNGRNSIKEERYERAITESLVDKMREHHCVDLSLLRECLHASGMLVADIDGHKNTFHQNPDGLATHDETHSGAQRYLLSLHTGNVIDLTAQPDTPVYFTQQTEYSAKEILAGHTMVASNEEGVETTFGSYYGGDASVAGNDYEKNLIEERLKIIRDGKWSELPSLVPTEPW